MNQQDEMRAQQILNQLRGSGLDQPADRPTYEPDPNAIDNQGNAGGVETLEIPGIGVVYKDANISTDSNKDNKSPAPPSVYNPPQQATSPTGISSQCPQCGKYHPPLKEGASCPMAPVKIKTASGEERIIDVNMFLDKMKVIFLSQLEQKPVVDPDDFMKYLIVETTKIIEKYGKEK